MINNLIINILGVMLSHRNLISAMSSLINIAQFKPNDRYIGYLPLAHVLELLAETSCLLYGIKVGYRLVILDFKNSPDENSYFLEPTYTNFCHLIYFQLAKYPYK